MMRIITGSARGTKLATLEGEHTRPTAERTKEAIFSVLQFQLRGRRVLDLFAGSGQMGLEALSRGAAEATLVDAAGDAVQIIKENIRRTHFENAATVHKTDALGFLRTYSGAPFGLLFLDPPYASGLIPQCLGLLSERGLLAPDAVLVCEAGSRDAVFGTDAALREKFEIKKESRYGVAHVLMLVPVAEEKV